MSKTTVDSHEPIAEAQAIINALEDAHPYHVVGVGEQGGTTRQVLVVKEGHTFHSVKPLLDVYRTAPERRKGTAKFTDLESFIAHCNRFKDADSVVFASDAKGAPSLTSVLDYHRAEATGAPRFGEHRGHYAFPLSDEWQAWVGSNGRQMTQADFARFMEDRLGDVALPESAKGPALEWAAKLGTSFASPSRLLELSRGLSATVKFSVREHHDLASGEGQVSFAAEHADVNGAPLKVPSSFLLGVPVFRNGSVYALPARLRYRVKDGTITWSYELARVDATFDHAFAEALDLVQHAVSLPLYRGTPE